ncbi:MAG: site-specific integrase [Burkholderiaceae bacterium]|nr:site-specific integrase [Burkholderiaceae bacterium]
MTGFSVVSVDLESGEQMPLLCDAGTGLGLFEPTAYALTMRSRGRAVNTIGQALRSVQLLYQILSASGIDLIERVKNNELLTLGEVETLVEQCKLKKQDLDEIHRGPPKGQPARLSIARFKKGGRQRTDLAVVSSNTALVRLKYVAQYLAWLAEYAYLQKLPRDREVFKGVADKTIRALSSRVPLARKSGTHARKRGLTKTDEAELLEIVRPQSPRNPWSDEFLQLRNHLIVYLLLGLGIRKGEMLGVKAHDINLSESRLFIARRADDPEERRRRRPATKTYDRGLQVGAELLAELKRYLALRSKLSLARKHPYLIVGERGEPLSLNAVDYMFATLRKCWGGKPLSAHLLRHTWNDRFSELVEGKLTEDEEKKVRNYLMGWSDQSRSAENYTVRYVEQKAHTALTELQEKMFKAMR